MLMSLGHNGFLYAHGTAADSSHPLQHEPLRCGSVSYRVTVSVRRVLCPALGKAVASTSLRVIAPIGRANGSGEPRLFTA